MPKDVDAVSIRIHLDNKLWLESLKLYPRETIDGVLTRLRLSLAKNGRKSK